MPASQFDVLMLRELLADEDSPSEWILHDDGERCFTRASYSRVSSVPSEETQGAEPDLLFIDLRTERIKPGIEKPIVGIPHSDFIGALTRSISGQDDVLCVTSIDLVFPASCQWRLPILTNPPEVGDAHSALGTISLSGITMRFRDSPLGVIQAALEHGHAGEDEHKLRLLYRFQLPIDEIDDVYTKATQQAEKTAALFIGSGT